jgi:hypothetical protein
LFINDFRALTDVSLHARRLVARAGGDLGLDLLLTSFVLTLQERKLPRQAVTQNQAGDRISLVIPRSVELSYRNAQGVKAPAGRPQKLAIGFGTTMLEAEASKPAAVAIMTGVSTTR